MENRINTKAIAEDFASLLRRGPGMTPSAIEAAMYIEDCLDVVLSDEEIAALDPADPEAVGRILDAKARP
jgi:hypothetical protein